MIKKIRLHSKKVTHLAVILASSSILSPLHLSAEENVPVELDQELSVVNSMKIGENSTQTRMDEWIKEGNHWSYIDQKGKKQTGWTKIDDSWYYMNHKGAMQTGWNKIGNTWYYMIGGAMQTGWQKLGSNWYYMNDSGALQTGWTKVDNIWYYLDNNGVMYTGWNKIGNDWYYMIGGAMQTGWTQVGDTWYYMSPSGAMHTGWLKLNKKWYHMDSEGAMQTGLTRVGEYGNHTFYYMNKNGVMQTGWAQGENNWFYSSNNGEAYTGWIKSNNQWYYIINGKMQTGWTRVNNIWYNFHENGWMQSQAQSKQFPIAQGIPKGTKINERTSSYVVFDYPIKLADGSEIEAVVVEMTTGEHTIPELKSFPQKNIFARGTDSSGNYFSASLSKSNKHTVSYGFIGPKPEVSGELTGELIELLTAFYEAYSWPILLD